MAESSDTSANRKSRAGAWCFPGLTTTIVVVRARSVAPPGPAFTVLDTVTGNAGVRPGAGDHARWQGGGRTDAVPLSPSFMGVQHRGPVEGVQAPPSYGRAPSPSPVTVASCRIRKGNKRKGRR